MIIIFTLIKKTVGLRVSEKEEINGLDIEEHGLVSSYADFMPAHAGLPVAAETGAEVPESQAVEVTHMGTRYVEKSDDVKMTKLVMIIRREKFDALKVAMNNIGVTGMTVTQVMGCGMQKGSSNYYRGVPVDVQLLPKVKVETVVCKVPVDTVVETAKKVLYTGHIGDGKIFVYDVENVIKVRTGEEGYDALQDVE